MIDTYEEELVWDDDGGCDEIALGAMYICPSCGFVFGVYDLSEEYVTAIAPNP